MRPSSWTLFAAVVAVALSACTSERPSPQYAVQDLIGAQVVEANAPDAWAVYPGRTVPVLGTVGMPPERAVAFQIQLASEDSWADVFGSPISLTGSSYALGALGDIDLSNREEVHLRARWVFSGPEVSPWSETRIVKTKDSLPSVCVTAMAKAAEVPLSEDNNEEVRGALSACRTLENFITGLYMYPQVLGYNYGQLNQIRPVETAEIVCTLIQRARACDGGGDLGVYRSSD